MVDVRRGGVGVTDLDGQAMEGATYHVDWDTAAAEKAGYEYFMLKEIEEQPEAVKETIGGRLPPDGGLRLDELAISDEDIRGFHQAVIVACGSSYHSAMVGKYAIERWTRVAPELLGQARRNACHLRHQRLARWQLPGTAASLAATHSHHDRAAIRRRCHCGRGR